MNFINKSYSYNSPLLCDWWLHFALMLPANETGKQSKHQIRSSTPGEHPDKHSCLKQSSTGNDHAARVLRSAEITQCLMLPQEQLQAHLRSELCGAHHQSRRTSPSEDTSAAPSVCTNKVAVVTGLELLNLYSGEQNGTTASGETEEASLESYCANSLKLAHEHLDGATDHHAAKTPRRHLIHRIAEEVEEDDLQQQHEAFLGSSSRSSEDDFEDFCNDSFSRGLTVRKQSGEGSLTAIPNLKAYSCFGGMSRVA